MITKVTVLPIFTSAVITTGLYYSSYLLCINLNFSKFFEIFITAFSILIGFILATVTIFNTLQNEKLDFIKKSNGMESLYKSLRHSIYSGFFAIFISIIFFLFKDILNCYELIIYSIVGINIASMIYCLNFMKLFLNIVAKG